MLPVIGARRAGGLPRAAQAAQGRREVAVHRVAVVEEEVAVAAVAVVVAAAEQEID